MSYEVISKKLFFWSIVAKVENATGIKGAVFSAVQRNPKVVAVDEILADGTRNRLFVGSTVEVQDWISRVVSTW